MTREERYKIISEDYVDLIIKYNGNPISLEQFKDYSVHIMNDTYAVIYLPILWLPPRLLLNLIILPCSLLCMTSAQSLEASGVTR
jgi:hypothetical protein